MQLLNFIAFILLTVSIFLILRVTPQRVTQDILSIIHREKGLKWHIAMARKNRSESKINESIRYIQNALTASGKGGLFAGICMASFLLLLTGIIVSVLMNNLVLVLPLAGILAGIPFLYAQSTINAYNRLARDELETALSIVTTAYLRSDNLELAVKENISNIKPPLQDMFKVFLRDLKVNPDMNSALVRLRKQYANTVWQEWCDVLIDCQQDGYQKPSLVPIVAKLTDIRLINSEFDNLCYSARRGYITIMIMLIAVIPGIYLLNHEWFFILIGTNVGKVILALTLIAIAITFVRMLRVTKPIEFKR